MESGSERFETLVPPALAGERLDRALAALHPAGLSRSRLKALIEEGRVCVAGATITEPSRKVKEGETLDVDLPAAREATQAAEDIALQVVFEDDSLIVIDKPAGLVVHPAPGNAGGTLVNALLAHCRGSLSGIGGVERPGIVHRLDKDTSGLMVAAKTDRAHRHLSAQFARHDVERLYAAIVRGRPRPTEGDIEGNIGRDPNNRKRMALVKTGGKSARTHYRTVEPFGQRAALVECRLATGRTHQIRVHMASIGCPLVGDAVYARKARTKGDALDATMAAFPRQALDAFVLGFLHPETGERLRFARAYAPDIERLRSELAAAAKVAA
ncbi:MAG: RluA family pseudouridine synthase [Alphaproteobacteria bacterium]|nr:RluA family pseudouridine synthase [Alphaproteobacteria bacterium]